MKKPTKALPAAPGIYLFKNKANEVIYIGKAKSIAKRVASYFQKKHTEARIDSLITEYDDIDYILTDSEAEALLLEAQLIKQHQPKFNILLKMGDPYLYIMVTKDEVPEIKIVRNKEEKGIYFGPFMQKTQVRKAFNYIVRTFKLQVCNKKIANGCLDYHIGICAGMCLIDFDVEGYKFRMELAVDALKNTPRKFLKSIKEKIKEYNQNLEFEKSKYLNEYLENVDIIFETLKMKFSEKKYADQAFAATTIVKPIEQNYELIAFELQQLLKLDQPPIRIDCFDISHFQSRFIVGSCIRFAHGKPDKNNFRKFNIKTLTTQNDYAALQEIVTRRYRNALEIPDLIIIDGGKGQLNAARAVLPNVPIISIAKREETIYGDALPHGYILDIKTGIGQLIIAMRDYAHHFAISHHRTKRKKDNL